MSYEGTSERARQNQDDIRSAPRLRRELATRRERKGLRVAFVMGGLVLVVLAALMRILLSPLSADELADLTPVGEKIGLMELQSAVVEAAASWEQVDDLEGLQIAYLAGEPVAVVWFRRNTGGDFLVAQVSRSAQRSGQVADRHTHSEESHQDESIHREEAQKDAAGMRSAWAYVDGTFFAVVGGAGSDLWYVDETAEPTLAGFAVAAWLLSDPLVAFEVVATDAEATVVAGQEDEIWSVVSESQDSTLTQQWKVGTDGRLRLLDWKVIEQSGAANTATFQYRETIARQPIAAPRSGYLDFESFGVPADFVELAAKVEASEGVMR